jgi:hypothetical protein
MSLPRHTPSAAEELPLRKEVNCSTWFWFLISHNFQNLRRKQEAVEAEERAMYQRCNMEAAEGLGHNLSYMVCVFLSIAEAVIFILPLRIPKPRIMTPITRPVIIFLLWWEPFIVVA